ncbi:MAG: hypothetical protein AAFX41_11315 [Bacteroidota bacterium]
MLLATLNGDGVLQHWNVIGNGLVGRMALGTGDVVDYYDAASGADMETLGETAVSDAIAGVLADALAPVNHPDGQGGTLLTQAEADAVVTATESSLRTLHVDEVAPAIGEATAADGTVDPKTRYGGRRGEGAVGDSRPGEGEKLDKLPRGAYLRRHRLVHSTMYLCRFSKAFSGTPCVKRRATRSPNCSLLSSSLASWRFWRFPASWA